MAVSAGDGQTDPKPKKRLSLFSFFNLQLGISYCCLQIVFFLFFLQIPRAYRETVRYMSCRIAEAHCI